jgi:trimeric autotransporter adhesin
MTNFTKSRRLALVAAMAPSLTARTALFAGALLALTAPAEAQSILFGGIGDANVCTDNGTIVFYVDLNNCAGFINEPTSFNVLIPSLFNDTAIFNAAITTNGIANTGDISTTGSLSSNTIFGNSATITNILSANGSFTNSLSVIGVATIDMGGNIIHGVAPGVAATDAVNVGQLNAATSGITADVTALETLTATHTTQITAIQAVNTTQSGQITAIEAANVTQSGQIGALQSGQELLSGQVDTLFDLRRSDRRDMKQGVAAAMSMASAPMPSEPGRISYAVNGATFRGEYALGGSLMYRLPGRTPFAVNVGFSYGGNKNNGARIGVAGEF